MSKTLTAGILITLLLVAVVSFAGSVPRQIAYQGTIEDNGGQPVTEQVQVIFAIYDDAVVKAQLWAETLLVDPGANGSFSKVLGEVHEIQDTVMDGGVRWLGITIGTDAELTPRTLLTASPYSLRVGSIDDADAGVINGVLTLAPTTPGGDDAAINLQNSSGENAFSMSASTDVPIFIARGPGGDDDQTVITGSGVQTPQLNVQVASVRDGSRDCTGPNLLGVNTQGNSAVGEGNDLSAANNSFAVGLCNTVSGDESMVIGTDNAIGGSVGAFVVGSANSVMDNSDRSVVMGVTNYASGYENICFGKEDSVQGSNYSSILSGAQNLLFSGYDNSIISGRSNVISGSAQSIICGGDRNSIDSTQNLDGEQLFLCASIAGGSENIASDNYATVSGGQLNEARGLHSTVGGGAENEATNRQTTVAGGRKNQATGEVATVSGGDSCMADGNYATVPGGGGNRAGGDLAKANPAS